jgi:RNA-directed DNA polymerase
MIGQLLSRENLLLALKRVETNKGSHGVDDMPVKSLRKHIQQNWHQIRKAIEEGTYEPSPVRRVEIPKPNGGTRMKDGSKRERTSGTPQGGVISAVLANLFMHYTFDKCKV